MQHSKKRLFFFTAAAIATVSAAALTAAALIPSGSEAAMNSTKMQEFHIESDPFKVAVISDTQLPPTEKQMGEDDTFLQNLKKTLTVFRGHRRFGNPVCLSNLSGCAGRSVWP